MKLSDKWYDILKNRVIPILTGGATLVITLGELWHFPTDTIKAIAGTMTAVATFISFLINSSSKVYFKDKEIVESTYNNASVDKNG